MSWHRINNAGGGFTPPALPTVSVISDQLAGNWTNVSPVVISVTVTTDPAFSHTEICRVFLVSGSWPGYAVGDLVGYGTVNSIDFYTPTTLGPVSGPIAVDAVFRLIVGFSYYIVDPDTSINSATQSSVTAKASWNLNVRQSATFRVQGEFTYETP